MKKEITKNLVSFGDVETLGSLLHGHKQSLEEIDVQITHQSVGPFEIAMKTFYQELLDEIDELWCVYVAMREKWQNQAGTPLFLAQFLLAQHNTKDFLAKKDRIIPFAKTLRAAANKTNSKNDVKYLDSIIKK